MMEGAGKGQKNRVKLRHAEGRMGTDIERVAGWIDGRDINLEG